MEHYLSFNGKSSRDFGITISGSGTYTKPARRVERVVIPGRNGELTISDGSWENVIITYPCFAFRNFPAKMDWISAWLLAPAGYCRLEDTYHPEHFRYATFHGGIEPTAATLNRHGRFDLQFNCKPMKYLKNGFQWMRQANNTFVNPTGFPAKPIIAMSGLHGARILEINGTRVKVGARAGSDTSVAFNNIYLDCETWEAYEAKDTPNINTGIVYDYVKSQNELVELLDEKYPELAGGSNTVNCKTINTGYEALADLYIMPRWWVL